MSGGMVYTYKPGVRTPVAVHEEYEPLDEVFEAECTRVIEAVRALPDWGIARFIQIADLHSKATLDTGRKQLLLAAAKLKRVLALDGTILSGDIGDGTDDDAEGYKALYRAILALLGDDAFANHGNHDDNSVIASGNTAPTPENVVTNKDWNWITTIGAGRWARRIVAPVGANGYYYIDWPEKKLRLVNINSSDLTEEERLATGGQNWHKLSAEQLAWLDEEALVVPEGWKIICTCHVTAMLGMAHNLGLENRAELYALLEKYKDSIVAYLCGHGHMDAHYIDPNTGIAFVMSATAGGNTVDAATVAPAGFGYRSISDEAKAAHPCGKFGFDIVIVHADGSISRVRFGAQFDVYKDETTTV